MTPVISFRVRIHGEVGGLLSAGAKLAYDCVCSYPTPALMDFVSRIFDGYMAYN